MQFSGVVILSLPAASRRSEGSQATNSLGEPSVEILSGVTKSPPLKFRRAQNQARDDAQVHLLARIIELRLQNLRIVELFL